MRHLYIIGARGFGREVYTHYLECKSELKDIECVGFLDDNPNILNGFDGYPPVIDSVERYLPKENDVFICALGEPKWIKYYTDIIERKNGNFISLIHPCCSLGLNVKIGEGSIISRWAVISSDVIIGKHSSIGIFSNLGHDVIIKDYCHIGAYSFFGGGAVAENCVTCHPRVNILPHKRIGENSIIGASSVVIKNIPTNVTVFGIPAKKVLS